MRGWIGCDLDETLAHRWEGDYAPDNIGAPIPGMVERIKKHLADGSVVKIFTARVYYPAGDLKRKAEAEKARAAIAAWTLKHLGRKLEATCEKDFMMVHFYDDRAIQVVPNTGIVLQDLIEDSKPHDDRTA